MKASLFKGKFSNPFDKRERERYSNVTFWTTQRLRLLIRLFAVVFIISVTVLIVHRIADKPLTFEQKLMRKEAVYLPIKAPPFRVTDAAKSEVINNNPAESERTFQTQLYSIGNLRYRAVTVYWNKSDIPEGTTYKQVSPLGAMKELIDNERYDGVVFMLGAEGEEYYSRSTFDDFIAKLKLQQAPSVRIKDSVP